MIDDRTLFNQGLRERGYWPQVPYPANIYVAETAGLEIKNIPAEAGIARDGCWYMARTIDENGYTPVMKDQYGNAIKYWHKYTPDQHEVINKYWHLLSDECRIDEE